MATRANLIKCRGLHTHGNELSLPEGSLRRADNVNIDEDGVITPRRGFNDFGGASGGAESQDNILKQMMQYKNSIIRHYQNLLEFEDSEGVFQAVVGQYNELEEGLRIKFQEANSNLYFTTDDGIKKISVTQRSDLNANMVTNAGGIKAGYAFGTIVPTIGGFLPPQSKVAYRVLFGTKDANGNLIDGSPSSRFVVTNFSEDIGESEISTLSIDDASAIVANDLIVYTNSVAKYVIYFNNDPNADVPQTAETIGGTYVRTNFDTGSANNTAAFVANAISNSIANVSVEIDSLTPSTVRVSSTETGDIEGFSNPSNGTAMSQSTVDGSVSEGTFANVKITGVVPSDATTDYFYQVYRTAFIEAAEGLTLNDIDPGDEASLVFEAGLTDADIANRQFEFEDNTPDSFRASNAPLYTNEITGEGILQSNEAPPIAKDIALFRNSMFYGNTKSRHQLEFDLISVNDFVSGTTRFIIGNDQVTRYYTFVGSSQIQSFTINSEPNAGDYINISSANNERVYYIYFGDAADDPEVPGALAYRIALDGSSTTVYAERIVSALIDNGDFTTTNVANEVTLTYLNNGYTNGITSGTNPTITINIPSVSGTGELANTNEGGDVLLSGLVSTGQAIDETARSLVKIISQDNSSPVNAFYLSTSEDLPGQILLESRQLEDRSFYIAIEEETFSEIGKEFSPELPSSKSIEELQVANSLTTITLTGHGYTNGQEIFISYFDDPSNPQGIDSFSGIFAITVIDSDNFSIERTTANTGTVTNPEFSAVYSPDVVSDNSVAENRLFYSKLRQPEAVPPTNFIDVGPKDEQIRRILALRDNLFVLKDDGIYIVSGTSAPDFSVRLLDNTRIIAPDSAVVLNNQIFCLTEQGITIVTDSGAGVISRPIENQIDLFTNQGFDFAKNTFGIAYENDRAYIMFCPEKDSDTSATQAFRYNVFERTWSRWEYEATCGIVMERDSTLYVGNGDRNFTSKERKDNSRTDHSDRDFTISIGQQAVNDDTLEVSTLVDVEVSDVITQVQDVTINYLNRRLLVKMDFFDTGITPPSGSTMFDSFSAAPGDNLATKMQALNDYLVTLDPVNITAKSFTASTLRSLTELLVSELNAVDTITSVKSYKNPQTVVYEAYIKGKDVTRNQVIVHAVRPWVEGDIQVYKHFTKTVEYNPQHFGDPSALKQIRYVTIMFDQNNFYDAKAKFASDAAQALKEVDFQGKGIGYWGDMPWSDPNHYWGGVGNDIPFRTPVPRGKQKCRYLSLTFEHKNSREFFRIVGISGEVRAISGRAYR